MYKVLGIVCVVAALALGTSVVTAVIQRSDYAKESSQISNLKTEQSDNRRELGMLRSELRRLGHDATTSQADQIGLLGRLSWQPLGLRSAD
jgi:uncharacterized protein HemX